MSAAANDPGAASGVLAPRLIRLARHGYSDRLLRPLLDGHRLYEPARAAARGRVTMTLVPTPGALSMAMRP